MKILRFIVIKNESFDSPNILQIYSYEVKLSLQQEVGQCFAAACDSIASLIQVLIYRQVVLQHVKVNPPHTFPGYVRLAIM